MDRDENAPPSQNANATAPGLLSSSFGFLAGVRAMLSPKDPLSETPIVSGRPALRDANAAASPPNQKSYMTGAQGLGGQVPAETPGATLVVPDESTWQGRGDRTSVASENSFVSALSSGNTSLPDCLQAASPGRIDSDTDTSTAYESAGETEGNLSVSDEVFKSSDGVLLNRPIAVSSPFDTNHLNDTFQKSAKTGYNLNETVQLEDSAESGADPLSVSFLVDHLGSLSLSTPLKGKDDATSKGHVTLASDVSGDLNSSTEQDSISSAELEVKQSLDSTITLTEGDEKDIEVIPQENSSSFSEPNLTENCPKPQNLNQTVDIASDTSSGNLSVIEVAQPDADSEISAAALKELEGLGESLNYSSLNQSELSAIEAKLLEGLDETYSYPPLSATNSQSFNFSSFSQSEQSAIEQDLLDRLTESEPPSFPSENVPGSPCSQSESDDHVALNETVLEVHSKEPSKTDKEEPSSQEPDLVFTSQSEQVSDPDLSVQGTQNSQVCSQSVESLEAENRTSYPKLDEPSETISSSLDLEPATGEPNVVISGEVDPDTSENIPDGDNCQLPPEKIEVAQDKVSSFEDAPLPVKVPRTFEEILAEQLAAAGAEDLSSADPNIVHSTAASRFDEAPLPSKTQRTFDEILADELAAHNLESEATDLQPKTVTVPVDETPVADSNLSSSPQSMPESVSPEESVPSEVETVHGLESVEADQPEPSLSEFSGNSESDEVPIPVKPGRTFEEILEAQLAAQGDPENAVPTFSSEEAPIPIKTPRTFEEILAAELAAQNDPEQAIPSFSILQAAQPSPRKLNESYAKLMSSESSFIESESEPVLVSDIAHGELESESNNSLDLLMEKCKLQEQDLELGESEFKDLADEAGRLSLSCLSQSERASSVESEESQSSDFANQTVIRADFETSHERKSPHSNSQVQLQSPQVKVSDEEQFTSGEHVFVDPSGFDFLSQRGGPCSARDFRKESLYVKFDPLVGSLSSSIMYPDNSSDNQTAVADGQSSETQFSASEKLVSLSPASSKQATAPTTPLRSTVKSTPVKTPAHVMLNETLESIGARGASVKQEDLIKKLQEHQSVLEEQDKAYQERIAELEQRLQEMDLQAHQGDKSLQQQLQEKERQYQEKAQSLLELNLIMKEYEKTISRLVAEKSQEKAAFDEKQVDLVKERDQVQQHLNNMEIAFSDIHTKYERLKSIVETFKKNEETLNAALSEKQADLDKMQSMYDMLKSHAVSKLEKANQDLEGIRQKHQQENAKLKAMIKKLEIKTKSLEDTLEQKVKENQALTAICDELINKVGE